uniref:DUF4005 domain-containing protein n=1 Tax=Rhabditophanes sp. KR3021 TaxID=114890 RepID=A0AC35TIM0_9BILA
MRIKDEEDCSYMSKSHIETLSTSSNGLKKCNQICEKSKDSKTGPTQSKSFRDKLSKSFYDLANGSQDRLQKWKSKLHTGKKPREKDSSCPPPQERRERAISFSANMGNITKDDVFIGTHDVKNKRSSCRATSVTATKSYRYTDRSDSFNLSKDNTSSKSVFSYISPHDMDVKNGTLSNYSPRVSFKPVHASKSLNNAYASVSQTVRMPSEGLAKS